ncbi:MAG: EAL domain-containing protein [Actinomycetota bacterium]
MTEPESTDAIARSMASSSAAPDELHELIGVLPVAAVAVIDGVIVAANAAVPLLFRLEAVVGASLADLVHPRDAWRLDRWRAELELEDGEHDVEVAARSGSTQIEICARRQIAASGTPVDVLVLRDLTAHRAAELSLLVASHRQRAVLGSLFEGVLILDDGGIVTDANAAAADILEASGSLTGRSVVDLLQLRPEPGLPHLTPTDSRLLRAITGRVALDEEVTPLLQDGVERWLSVKLAPYEDPALGRSGAVCVLNDITARARAEDDLEYLAHHDPMTGLANRNRFEAEVRTCFDGEHRSACTVLIVDLDGFKEINDSISHEAGDRVLRTVGARLASEIRDTDRVARLGGDEFGILLVDPDVDVDAVAVRLKQAVATPIDLDGTAHVITASVGISGAAQAGDAAAFLVNADLALHAAKERGVGHVVAFDESMQRAKRRNLEIQAELARALECEEFTVVYQPKLRLADRRLVGFEALVRWDHPSRGRISPAEFVPIAERSGQIVALGQWVLRQATGQLRRWHGETGADHVSMAVNVSIRQLLDQRFADGVRSVLSEADLPAEALELEVTETMLMREPDAMVSALTELRRLGVSIAVDDYGTGNASLGYLRQLPLDVLKIDRELLVADELDQRQRAAFILSISALARTLGIRVVAEGIETEEQFGLARDLGCELGQGYLLGRPMDATQAARVIADSVRASVDAAAE